MVLILSEADVDAVLDLGELVPVVGDALVKQSRGAVERPDRPHFPVGAGLENEEPLGLGIAMPAYIHGDDHYVTKLVGVHEGNAARDLPTVHAQVVLTDARTGRPQAVMAGTTLTNARTGCVGALAVQALAPEDITLGVIGAGAQARWQTRAIATIATLADVRIYSPSDSKVECAADLRAEDVPARAVETPGGAIEDADVVVTATTATAPVFPADALAPGAVVVAVGAYTPETQELEPAVLDRAAAVFADVPDEVAETGDMTAAGLTAADLRPLGALLATGYERPRPDDTVVVVSVGSATMDAAAGGTVYRRARTGDQGTDLSL